MKKKFLTWKNNAFVKSFSHKKREVVRKVGPKTGKGSETLEIILKRWVKKTGFEFKFPTCDINEFTKNSLTWKQITCKKVPNMKG